MNMDLSRLVLVRPREFPHPEATARAAGADSVLAGARVVATLAEAIADCGFVVATTCPQSRPALPRTGGAGSGGAGGGGSQARSRGAAVRCRAHRAAKRRSRAAHLLLRIPASPEYPSLNLAMAVQLVSYEIFRARGAPGNAGVTRELDAPLATPPQMQQLYLHLEQVLEEVDFKDRTKAGTHLMSRIRRFLQRAELDLNEVNILRGILTAIQNRRRMAGTAHAPKP